MNVLLDTNVISELSRPAPDHGVIAWLDGTPEDALYISVATLAELHHGVENLPQGAKRSRLHAWLAEVLPVRFEGRILPVDMAVAQRWGILVAQCEKRGLPMESMDALLAATSVVYGLTLATRNTRHFSILGKSVFNPWDMK